MIKLSNEDKETIRRFAEVKNKGYYVNPNQLQSFYNKVFEVNQTATTCGSCLRKRINDLEKALRRQEEEEKMEAAKVVLSIFEDDEPKEEKKETEHTENEENNAKPKSVRIRKNSPKAKKGS